MAEGRFSEVTLSVLAVTDLAGAWGESLTSDMLCVIGGVSSKIYTVSFPDLGNLTSC